MNLEKIVKKVSEIIADRIENEKLEGKCNFYPFFLKYYLYRFHKINIDLNFGIIPNGDLFSMHNWNSFNGKIIDITIHHQLENAHFSSVILDEVYIDKGSKKEIYYNHNELPVIYLKRVQEASEESNRNNRSNPEIEKGLDADAFLLKFEKMNINDVNKTKNWLKNNYKKEMNEALQYMKNRDTYL